MKLPAYFRTAWVTLGPCSYETAIVSMRTIFQLVDANAANAQFGIIPSAREEQAIMFADLWDAMESIAPEGSTFGECPHGTRALGFWPVKEESR